MPPTRFATLAERIDADLDKDGDCWLWLGFRNQLGYGMLTYRRRTMYAHRGAYEAFHGPIPDGASVMHTCDTPDCCNPAHLTLGNHRENSLDMARKRRGAHQHNLSDEAVREIRGSSEKNSAIAKRFGINVGVVYAIRSGRSWTHVEQ